MNRFHWIMTGFLVLMIMCLFIIGSGMSKASTVKPLPKPSQCGTMAQMKVSLKTVSPPLQVSEVGPYGTQLFLSQYNAIEPVSNIIGDHTLIVEVTGSDRVTIVVFKDGCLATQNSISRHELRNILRSV